MSIIKELSSGAYETSQYCLQFLCKPKTFPQNKVYFYKPAVVDGKNQIRNYFT